ncbi:SDR family oxidoreductase [Brevundimonas pondensis]|uniref:SDR family oxidoreductase n=1 Tax=Brevundimonas pondensis TaxID=2774189 RepID=A0ABX7SLN2_9CAUL|nr:SDR family oxidoreductase [Brevundimonas pondensis]QTC88259.1 SDR family oxidoreductase [Brevundimonas pondensis]
MGDPLNKTVLITGAARRVGAGIARALAEAGWDVAVHHRGGAEEATALSAELSAKGVRVAAFQADLNQAAERDALIGRVVGHFGRIDALINNASLFRYDTLPTLTEASWAEHLASNLTAPVFLIRDFAKAVEAADGQGVVVNILDHKVDSPNPDFFAYTAGKVGLAGLTRTLAMGLAPRIRLCGVSPGLILRSGEQTEAEYEAAWRDTPLGRGASLEDVARTVRFILETPSLTGQNLTIDGGETLIGRGRDVAFDGIPVP